MLVKFYVVYHSHSNVQLGSCNFFRSNTLIWWPMACIRVLKIRYSHDS